MENRLVEGFGTCDLQREDEKVIGLSTADSLPRSFAFADFKM
jgi:hypothetical protein